MAEEKEETKVTLRCGVYGEATVFPVKIKRNAEGSELQEAIARTYKVVSNRVEVYPARLTLYLARKKGETTWMKHDHSVKDFLRGGISTEFEEMLSSWRLNKEELFGPSFTPEDEDIHVLVELTSFTPPEVSQDHHFVVGDVHIPITQSMSLNPPALVAFWEAFLKDRTEVEADALIELPRGTYLLGDDTLNLLYRGWPPSRVLCIEDDFIDIAAPLYLVGIQ